MSIVFGAFAQAIIKGIFFAILAILGIFAGKKYRNYKDSKKTNQN